MKSKTVKLNTQGKRKGVLSALLNSFPHPAEYTVYDASLGKTPDVVIHQADTFVKGMEGAVSELANRSSKDKEETLQILDVADDSFLKTLASTGDKLGSILTLCCVCADHVICSSPFAQENIYQNTGRIASIVEQPIYKKNLKKPDKNTVNLKRQELNILWIGSTEDIFSIKQYQTRFKTLNIQVNKHLDWANIVFLPAPFTVEAEQRREDNIIKAVIGGKLVCAPDPYHGYQSIAITDSLTSCIKQYNSLDIEKFVSQAQDFLLSNKGLQYSTDMFLAALNRAYKDDFIPDIDFALENENIRI